MGKTLTKPLQALFVTKEGVMFINEGFYLDNPKTEWPETLEANLSQRSPIAGAPIKQVLLNFTHGIVELPIAKIHVYLEEGPAEGKVATSHPDRVIIKNGAEHA